MERLHFRSNGPIYYVLIELILLEIFALQDYRPTTSDLHFSVEFSHKNSHTNDFKYLTTRILKLIYFTSFMYVPVYYLKKTRRRHSGETTVRMYCNKQINTHTRICRLPIDTASLLTLYQYILIVSICVLFNCWFDVDGYFWVALSYHMCLHCLPRPSEANAWGAVASYLLISRLIKMG